LALLYNFIVLNIVMEKILLQAQIRELKTRDSKALVKTGSIPAELYGHGVPNQHLSVNFVDFEKVLRKAGESTLIELSLPDGSKKNVLIQDVQHHYLYSMPIHVDFFEVKLTEKLTANIQIEFIGEADAVKVLGGTLVRVINEVAVECLPMDLPQHYKVDISKLKTFDDALTIADLPHSDKVQILADKTELIAKVQPPRDVEAELAESEIDEATAIAAAVGPEPDKGDEASADTTKTKE
jgi:large subunit ribosomal protein L25